MPGAIHLRKPRDFFLGLIFLVIAVGLVIYARQYEFGSARQIGPGFFPMLLGFLLGGFGCLHIALGFFGEAEPGEPIELRPIALVLAGVALFGILVRPAGLFISTLTLVIVAGAAYRSRRPLPLLIYAVAMAAGCVVVFPWLLGQQIPVLGSWFDR